MVKDVHTLRLESSVDGWSQPMALFKNRDFADRICEMLNQSNIFYGIVADWYVVRDSTELDLKQFGVMI